jgi:hypothetical protein
MISRPNAEASEIISTIFDYIQKNRSSSDVESLLRVLEKVVKIRRNLMQDEIIKESNCEIFAKLIITMPHEYLRQKMMSLIQAWAFMFKDPAKYCALEV